MLIFQQSEGTAARRRFPILLVDGSGEKVTGETGTPDISKNFGTFAATSATLTEVANGTYYVELTATELDTLGRITVHFDSANVATFTLTATVVPYDPFDANLGLTNLDAAVSSRAAPGAAMDLITDALDAAAVATAGAQEIRDEILSDSTPFAGANVDAAISTRSSHAAADVLSQTLSELAQAKPSATPTLEQGIMLLYMAMRNAETQTASEYTVANDAGTVIAKSALSDDGTTVTKDEMASGP